MKPGDIVIFLILAGSIWLFLQSLNGWIAVRRQNAIPTQQREANFDLVTTFCFLIGASGFSLVLWQMYHGFLSPTPEKNFGVNNHGTIVYVSEFWWVFCLCLTVLGAGGFMLSSWLSRRRIRRRDRMS